MPLTPLESKVLELSIKHNLGHIPSALTQVQYVYNTIQKTEGYYRVAGKPFGAQAWYAALGLDYAKALLEPPIVDWNCQTIGHALSYSLGVATCHKVWLNLSDAALECGDFWEALQLWHKIPHRELYVTIDCNGFGCRHNTASISDIKRRIESFDVPCRVFELRDDIELFDGIALIDTTKTIGAKLKEAGLHYSKFKSFEDFYAQCSERMVKI